MLCYAVQWICVSVKSAAVRGRKERADEGQQHLRVRQLGVCYSVGMLSLPEKYPL